MAWQVAHGGEAEDSRADDEDEGEEADGKEDESVLGKRAYAIPESPPLDEEVGVESIDLCGRQTSPTRRYRKVVGSASGAKLPGHSDRKELLGRIGCDKGAEVWGVCACSAILRKGYIWSTALPLPLFGRECICLRYGLRHD